MNLTDQQKETVKKWVAEGKGVSEIQRLLSSEFGIDMMYIDVRFLIDDIGAQIPSSGENAADSAQEASPVDAEGPQSGSAGENEAQVENPGESSGGVRVTVSPIQRPGAVMSGDVVFSDGMVCLDIIKDKWSPVNTVSMILTSIQVVSFRSSDV